ncbi:MAG TPA: hypothetical protein VGC36_17925 [Rhizomicrobium sp.]
MHKAIATGVIGLGLLCGACGDSGKQAAAAGCPTEDEIRAALTTYVEKDLWSAGERDIWKITGIDGFGFSGIRTGDIITKQVEYGAAPREVCPVRVTYSFMLHHADGRDEKKEMGADKTHLFYKGAFDAWTFKTD